MTGTSRRWSPGWWCTGLALRLAGASPERISARHQPSGRPLDALIIGGGDDIGPEHYQGEEPPRARIDPERDRLEIQWIRRALEDDLPLLGICRGAQLISVVLGGTLHQDIRPLRKRTHDRPGLLPTKQVVLEANSKLAGILGRTKVRVNSLHHQAIKDPGAGLRVVGRDRDGIAQAVEHTEGRTILGVQWHPEYLLYVPAQFRLFRALLKHA